MGTIEEPFWTTISILNTTRDRLKIMREKKHGYGKRKTLETIEDVVVRVLDFYDENSPSVSRDDL